MFKLMGVTGLLERGEVAVGHDNIVFQRPKVSRHLQRRHGTSVFFNHSRRFHDIAT